MFVFDEDGRLNPSLRVFLVVLVLSSHAYVPATSTLWRHNVPGSFKMEEGMVCFFLFSPVVWFILCQVRIVVSENRNSFVNRLFITASTLGFKKPEKRTEANMHLTSLSVSSIIVIIMCFFLSLHRVALKTSFLFSFFFCLSSRFGALILDLNVTLVQRFKAVAPAEIKSRTWS